MVLEKKAERILMIGFRSVDGDVICLQEIKYNSDQFDESSLFGFRI